MKKLFRKIGRRLKEPSSYGAIAAALAVFGINVEQEHVNTAIQIGAAISAAVSIFLPDFGSEDRPASK